MLLHGLGWLLLVGLVHLALCAEDYYKVGRVEHDVVVAGTDSSKILGVDKQASDKQLKSAYRQLSKKFHPDKNPYASSLPSAHAPSHVLTSCHVQR